LSNKGVRTDLKAIIQCAVMDLRLDDPTLYRDIVLVYSPPKVGSTSLLTSIRRAASDRFFTLHTHEPVIFNCPEDPDNSIMVSDVLRNASVFNVTEKRPRRIFVIDVYRTPIERKMSEFFHELSTLHFAKAGVDAGAYSMEKLTRRFNDMLPHMGDVDYFVDRFAVDSSMPEQQEIYTVERGGVTYIKLRFKDIARWGEILAPVLGITAVGVLGTRGGFEMVKDNETGGDLYRQFVEAYRLPYNYFKQLEEDVQLKRYYNFEERHEYLLKWWNKMPRLGHHVPWTAAEYAFYVRLCKDNQTHFRPLTEHYRDDGCLCAVCCTARRNGCDALHKKLVVGPEPEERNRIGVNKHQNNGSVVLYVYSMVV
jgi:hypothetical protein